MISNNEKQQRETTTRNNNEKQFAISKMKNNEVILNRDFEEWF
jgi:hypothetical protein